MQPYRKYLSETGAKWDLDAEELEAITQRFYAENPGWSVSYLALEPPTAGVRSAVDEARALKDRLQSRTTP
jgi:hypothetical protein